MPDQNKQISFKERVRQALISNSRSYKYYFVDYEYLLCSDAFQNNSYYIVAANEDNFLHLTGVISHISAQEFFEKCYHGTLEDADFEVDGNRRGNDVKGSVRRKIKVLPNIFGIFSSFPDVQEDFQKGHIFCSFATGMSSCTLGFTRTQAVVPQTLLKGNILDKDKSSSLRLVLRRSRGKDKFGEILVGGKETLLKYYDSIKPLLSEKLCGQIERLKERIDRITEMEAAFDRVADALHSDLPLSPATRADVKKLENYYSSDWLADFEADEKGDLPRNLKRGVLSEDALYDLLSEVAEK